MNLRVITSIWLALAMILIIDHGYGLSANVTTTSKTEAEEVRTDYFSMRVPHTWAYLVGSKSTTTNLLGIGPSNMIAAVPAESANDLAKLPKTGGEKLIVETVKKGGTLLSIFQDVDYLVKNAPLMTYTNNVIDTYNIQDKSNFQNKIIGNENGVRFYGMTNQPDIGYLMYTVIHKEQPYQIGYFGNTHSGSFQKYLPQVEEMIKSIKWIDTPTNDAVEEESAQETKGEILCVEYTVNNICKHGVDPKLWTLVDQSTDFGVIYFCQDAGSIAMRDTCFYLYTNQTSDIIKDKINKAFGVQIK
jgi:hypothetical protein